MIIFSSRHPLKLIRMGFPKRSMGWSHQRVGRMLLVLRIFMEIKEIRKIKEFKKKLDLSKKG